MKLLLICLVLVAPLGAIAAQASSDLFLPSDSWLRGMAYMGSLALGGYLVWWLTQRVWPEALAALRQGFAGVSAEVKKMTDSAEASHADQLEALRSIQQDIAAMRDRPDRRRP